MPTRKGHGFWAYLLPMFSFLALVQFSAIPGSLLLKVVVPGGLVIWYTLQGGYEEFAGFRLSPAGLAGDVLVGFVGALVWMAPYVLFDGLRPDPDDAFDPAQLGEGLVPVVLALRFAGYALVTPFVEELFVRSWLDRFSQVWNRDFDFRDVPIAQFTWTSFLVVCLYFTFSHVPWEYPVAVLWIVGTQLWFYRRRHILALVLVHAVSNATIFAAVLLFDQRLTDGEGRPIGLLFFL